MKFRKKPVVIEAELEGTQVHWALVPGLPTRAASGGALMAAMPERLDDLYREAQRDLAANDPRTVVKWLAAGTVRG